MNKSKFLKKSLAMLLALMLVVAMIPLSASAAGALPNLTMIYIDGKAVEVSGDTFSANIAEAQTHVKIKVDKASLVTTTGDATVRVVKEGTTDTYPVVPDQDNTIELAKWAESDGLDVTLTLQVVSPDNKTTQDYTVALTRVLDGRTAYIDKVTKGDGTYRAYVVENQDTNNVYLDIADGALDTGRGAYFTVYPADNATIEGDNPAEIKVTKNGQKFEIESESGTVQAEYTIYVTEYDGLTGLDIDGVAAEINQDEETVTVTLPREVAYDSLGYALKNVWLPMNFTFYGDDSSLKVDGDEFISGSKIDLGNLSKEAYEATLTLDCAGYESIQDYELTVKLEAQTNTAIERVQINEQLLTEVEGNNIYVDVPSNTDLTSVDVVLFTDPSVKSVSGFVRAQKDSGKVYGVDKDANGNLITYEGYTVWVYSGGDSDYKDGYVAYKDGKLYEVVEPPKTANIENGLIVTVTSEANTTEQYTIYGDPQVDTKTAKLISLILQDPKTGKNYEGKIDGNFVTFTDIPYMTIDVEDWKVFAKTNDAATAKYSNSVSTIINGTTTGADLGFTYTLKTKAEIDEIDDAAAKNEVVITVENMNEAAVKNEYHVVIDLPDPDTGKTLNAIKFNTLFSDDADFDGFNNDQVYARFDTTNIVNTKVEDDGEVEANTGTVTLRPAYSLSSKNNEVGDENIYNIVKEFSTNNGGVAFLAKKGAQYAQSNGTEGDLDYAVALNAIVNDKNDYDGTDKAITAEDVVGDAYVIVVLPEEEARKVLTSTPGSWGQQVFPEQWKKGTVYELTEDPADPSHNAKLEKISIGSSQLTVGKDTISGTLAFSNTTDSITIGSTADVRNDESEYATFELGNPYAILSTVDDVATGFENALVSGGADVNGDGDPDADASEHNQKLLFVRNNDANKTVSVYAWDGKNDPKQIDSLWVMAEDRLNTTEDETSVNEYRLALTWQTPCTEAEIESFSINGRTGRITEIKEDTYQISLNLPYGTDLKGLVADFETSLGATVTVLSSNNIDMISGKTSLNYNEPVKLKVTSEDRHRVWEYTVVVTTDNQFSDVNTDDWFYKEVMQAANNGWVNGQGDGIFNPNGDMKRGDFALIVARIMGYNENEFADTVFPDVANDDYYCAAIAFCKQKGLIDGDDKGYFNPEDSITREQMAKIICNARGLTQVSDPVKVYSDDAKIANWAKGYVYACQAEGIMAGEEAVNMFYPKDNASRAEAAAVLVRAFA